MSDEKPSTMDQLRTLIGSDGDAASASTSLPAPAASPLARRPLEAVASALRMRLDGIVTGRCPIVGLKGKGGVWVAPDLKAEIAYRGLTTAGELRQASFKGLIE